MTVRSNETDSEAIAPGNSDEPEISWARLEAHLAKSGISIDTTATPERFPSGFGNLNFLIHLDGHPAVLRRPPFGPIPPGANDMAREARILDSLHSTFPLAPRMLHFCDNPEVLGAPFFIMEYRPGLVIGTEIPDAVIEDWQDDQPIGVVLSNHLISILAELHAIDPARVNLDTLGKPDGFLKRTLNGWTMRAELAWNARPPTELAQLVHWLQKYLPTGSTTSSLIHNDFKLDNVILDPATLAPVAVIDWDMGTRGTQLYDLAVLLSYWTQKDDPQVMHDLRQMPSAEQGFPTRDQVANQYALLTDTPLSDFVFYRVLATLRVAVVFKQLHQRFLSTTSVYAVLCQTERLRQQSNSEGQVTIIFVVTGPQRNLTWSRLTLTDQVRHLARHGGTPLCLLEIDYSISSA